MTTEKHKSQRSETILLGEVRIAFPFHQEKRTKSAGGKPLDRPRNDCVVLVPKLSTDPAQCANYGKLAVICMEAARKAWPSSVDAAGNWMWPAGGKWPIQDGDTPHVSKPKPGVPAKTPEQTALANKWRTGSWVIEVSTNLDPGPRVCVMQNGVAQEIPAKVVAGVQLYKSGDFGYVSLNAYSFQNETWGVNFGYEGVLYTRPGEAIGSSGPRSAQQMFGTVAGTAPVAAPLPPSAGAAPAAPPAPGGQVAAPPQMPAPPMAPAMPAPPAMPQTQGYVPPGPTAGAVASPPPGLPAFPVPR
jgi:hypothetical protein